MTLKNKVIKNKEFLKQKFPEHKLRLNQFQRRLEKLSRDGDIINFFYVSLSTRRELYEFFTKNGYKSTLDIIKENMHLINIGDVTKADTLITGNCYNYMEISAFAKNFNFQKGMYYNEEENNIIIKSQIKEGKYPDKWIVKDKILLYCLENENDINNNYNLTFKKTPNKMIYERLNNINNADIHVFLREYDGFNYKYFGKANPISLENDNKAIKLKLLSN